MISVGVLPLWQVRSGTSHEIVRKHGVGWPSGRCIAPVQHHGPRAGYRVRGHQPPSRGASLTRDVRCLDVPTLISPPRTFITEYSE